MDGEQSSRTQWYHFQRGRRTRMSPGLMELVNGPPNNFFQLRGPIPSRRELHQWMMLLPSCDRTPPQNCVGGDTSSANADHESAWVGQTSVANQSLRLAAVSTTRRTPSRYRLGRQVGRSGTLRRSGAAVKPAGATSAWLAARRSRRRSAETPSVAAGRGSSLRSSWR